MKKWIILFLLCYVFTSCAPAPQMYSRGTGLGGSTARFTIVGDYLYTLQNLNIYVFNIKEDITFIDSVYLGWGPETLFPLDPYLFVGERTGIRILSLDDPASPKQIGFLSHVNSCDPVVVKGDVAFATLRSGDGCRMGKNALLVLDISNKQAPILKREYMMTQPRGLGLDGNFLYVCDKNVLLKYSIINKYELKQSQSLNVTCQDLIANRSILTTTGKNGIIQFREQDKLREISKIPLGGTPIPEP